MDFSPKLISRTPSSHPEADVSSPPPYLDDDAIQLTSNDSTNSDPCLERRAARGGIKPLQQRILCQWAGIYDCGHTGAWRLLFPPEIVVLGTLVVKIADVFNRNLISIRGLVFAIALLEHFPGNTHCVKGYVDLGVG